MWEHGRLFEAVRIYAELDEGKLVLLIPPDCQARTHFDQKRLGVLSCHTLPSGVSVVGVRPETLCDLCQPGWSL